MSPRYFSLFLIALSFTCVHGEDSDHPAFLPQKLENAKGKKVDPSLLKGKTIGLYFSASWCAPCRAFTPRLKAFRNAHVDEGFEVVLVNLDRTSIEKRNYMRKSEMDWPSVAGTRNRAIRSITETYSVETFPTLIILSPNGTVLSRNGVAEVTHSPESAFQAWTSSPRSES